jgi:hypothetical protein
MKISFYYDNKVLKCHFLGSHIIDVTEATINGSVRLGFMTKSQADMARLLMPKRETA